ncbi:Putative hemolysin [Aneurinibacillus thermoaerophilus]|uniref:Putative hemolysin n=1 Tax=Aneurinibacillus thermoaerophilus TaxID=143495 RepID=A0A1G7Z398_ANETH|nr:GNAT family N-acyltransferase [Aneurinibacillus sp. XH2]AMA72374.1 hypothetical protein ACH33_05570 [Aneurinibacillus sp. XH2]SDH03241.1 Putative hemolysin [Aneurinibacillus thermoaerophilus]
MIILNTLPALQVKLADCEDELKKALRLRYEVFAEKEANPALYNESRMESDIFDEHCDHLIVKDTNTNQVVGTYRLLPGERAVMHKGFYSETEFDLSGFTVPKSQILEVGRSCVAPEYRDGKTIQLLWEGIAGYIMDGLFSHLIGCASIPVQNIHELNRMYTFLCAKKMITDRFKVQPLMSHRVTGLRTVDITGQEKNILRTLPPLIKGYQRLGAEIAGAPAFDPIFQTTDFFIVLETSRIAQKYKRHFIKTP